MTNETLIVRNNSNFNLLQQMLTNSLFISTRCRSALCSYRPNVDQFFVHIDQMSTNTFSTKFSRSSFHEDSLWVQTGFVTSSVTHFTTVATALENPGKSWNWQKKISRPWKVLEFGLWSFIVLKWTKIFTFTRQE